MMCILIGNMSVQDVEILGVFSILLMLTLLVSTDHWDNDSYYKGNVW